MIKKSAEIEIKSNASATKADIDNLSNSTDKLSNSTKIVVRVLLIIILLWILQTHINRWFSRSNKKCC
jgi:hypothetical protein